MGFAASLMMKAKSLKEGATGKTGGLNIGNVQVGSCFHSIWCKMSQPSLFGVYHSLDVI